MSDLFDDEDLARAQTVVTHLMSQSGLPQAANLAIVVMFAAFKIERSLREVVDRANGEDRAQRRRKIDGADA
jgi:hypothetical protein